MKTVHKVFIIIGLFFIAACIFLAPRYYAIGKAEQAILDGGSAMMTGQFEVGAAHTRYGLEQLKFVNGAPGRAAINTVRTGAADAARANPQQSLPALMLLHDYGIGLTCEQKQAVAEPLLRHTASILKKQNTAAAGASLYTAAIWLQDCPFDGKKLAMYNSLLDTYAEMGGTKHAWLDKARDGQTVDPAFTVPVLKADELEKLENIDVKTRAMEFKDSAQYTATRLVAAGAAVKPPARPALKKKSQPKKKDDKKPAEADKPSFKEKVPEPEPQAAPAEKKAEPTKPAAAGGKQGALVSTMPPAGKMSPDKAASAIKDALAGNGLDVSSVVIPDSAKVVIIRYRSASVKDALFQEYMDILDQAYTIAGTGEAGISAAKITVQINGRSGEKRYTLSVSTDAFAQYKAGGMNRDTFLGNHVVRE